jgi:hypothetical protein
MVPEKEPFIPLFVIINAVSYNIFGGRTGFDGGEWDLNCEPSFLPGARKRNGRPTNANDNLAYAA